MPKNQDQSPPNLNPIAAWPLSFKPFVNGAFPVYWLPGQYYDPSAHQYIWTEEELPKNPTLHIPKMGRFIYTYPDNKDLSAEWGDADTDGGGGVEAASIHLWQWSQRRYPDVPGTEDILDYYVADVPSLTPTGTSDALNKNYLGPGVCSATVEVRKNGSVIDSQVIEDFVSWNFPSGPYAQITKSCT